MNNDKKTSSITTQANTRPFTEIFFTVYAFLFLVAGLSLLFFTKEVSLITTQGECEKFTNLIQKFLANTYLFIGILIFLIRKTEGRAMTNILVAFIFSGFIHMYLLFLLSDYTFVPSVFFIAHIVMQFSIFITLFDQIKRK